MRIKGFWSYNINPNLKNFFELILRIVWGIMIFVNVLHALEVREEIPLWQDIVFITGWYFALQMMKEGGICGSVTYIIALPTRTLSSLSAAAFRMGNCGNYPDFAVLWRNYLDFPERFIG